MVNIGLNRHSVVVLFVLCIGVEFLFVVRVFNVRSNKFD